MPKPKIPAKRKPEIQQILEKAAALDRRRQAQIKNQSLAITRLLEAMNGGKTLPDAHTEEMQILHAGAAVLQVENQDMRAALKALVDAIDAMPMDAISPKLTAPVSGTLAVALSDARTLATSDEG